MILKEIDPDNFREINSLKVKESQKKYVAENVTILARAYVYRDDDAKALGIYKGDTAVGCLMYRNYFYNGKKTVILEQFMIDSKFQGKGYGSQALKIWLEYIESLNIYKDCMLCYEEGNDGAFNLYSKFGFVRNPEMDDEDELVMVLKFGYK